MKSARKTLGEVEVIKDDVDGEVLADSQTCRINLRSLVGVVGAGDADVARGWSRLTCRRKAARGVVLDR